MEEEKKEIRIKFGTFCISAICIMLVIAGLIAYVIKLTSNSKNQQYAETQAESFKTKMADNTVLEDDNEEVITTTNDTEDNNEEVITTTNDTEDNNEEDVVIVDTNNVKDDTNDKFVNDDINNTKYETNNEVVNTNLLPGDTTKDASSYELELEAQAYALEKLLDNFDTINEHMTSSYREAFNSSFRVFEGEKPGPTVVALVKRVVLSNSVDLERQVSIEFMGKIYSNDSISDISNLIKPSDTYNVTLKYNSEDYVEVISVTHK